MATYSLLRLLFSFWSVSYDFHTHLSCAILSSSFHVSPFSFASCSVHLLQLFLGLPLLRLPCWFHVRACLVTDFCFFLMFYLSSSTSSLSAVPLLDPAWCVLIDWCYLWDLARRSWEFMIGIVMVGQSLQFVCDDGGDPLTFTVWMWYYS